MTLVDVAIQDTLAKLVANRVPRCFCGECSLPGDSVRERAWTALI